MKYLIYPLVMSFFYSCSTANLKQRRIASSEAKKAVVVHLVHNNTLFSEESDDEDQHITSLGVLRSAETSGVKDIELNIEKNGKKTTLVIDGYSTFRTLDLFNEQLSSGKIVVHAKTDNYKDVLTVDSLKTDIPGFQDSLKFEKVYNLNTKNLFVNYKHKFPYREHHKDDNLNKTYLGTVYKIKFEERGPRISWNTITLYSEFEAASFKPKTVLFGMIDTGKDKLYHKKIKSSCSITMKVPHSYNLLKEILEHNEMGETRKYFDCTSERYIWEDEVSTNLPRFDKAIMNYNEKVPSKRNTESSVLYKSE